MKVIEPKGLEQIKAGDVGHCVCSNGSASAKVEGFWRCRCGHQCSYGATNNQANYNEASSRPADR